MKAFIKRVAEIEDLDICMLEDNKEQKRDPLRIENTHKEKAIELLPWVSKKEKEKGKALATL